MLLLRRPISAPDLIPDRFYDISMEFLSLSSDRLIPPRETSPVEKMRINCCFRRLIIILWKIASSLIHVNKRYELIQFAF